MTKQGQLNQEGINAQNWAAMSLFLQYVTRSDFRYIGFEGEKLEDFYLVFGDGKKIICESKASNINLNEIRKILDKVIKHGQVSEQDEILIVCKEVNKEAKGLIDNFKYFGENIEKKLKSKRHKFEDKHLKLLPQLKFWEVSEDINRQATETLMAKVLSYPNSFWVPDHRLKEMTKSLVEEKVFRGSAKGKTLTRDGFLKLLESKKIQILEDDGYDYEKIRNIEEKDIERVIKAIKSKDKELNINNEIIKLYANSSIHYFTLQKLGSEKNLKLSEWVNLWTATYQSAFSIELFKIFENNIFNKENQEFVLDFILKTIVGRTNYFREEFIKYDIVKLCKKIIENNQSLENKIFEVIKKIYEYSIEKFLYIKRRRDDSWERDEITKLLYNLYEKTKKGKLKKEIIEYILKNFNIVEDDGKFWHYTPPSIFNILKEFLKTKREDFISKFVSQCINQFDRFYKTFGRKLGFDGWEHIGGGISQSGNEFAINDRYFVTKVISPVLLELYKKNKEKTWQFIFNVCITRKTSNINRNKPDFLNRASIGILFQEYKSGKHSKEAFEILSDFVKMRKGIPWKADLIFQELRGDYTDEQKWNLIKISLDEYKNLPVNVFVEQIISDLATKSKTSEIHQNAIDTLKKWATDPEYQKRHSYGELDTVDSALKLINNPESRNEGIGILETYIQSEHFKTKRDTFDTYDVANTLSRVLEEDSERGLAILEKVIKENNLTVNQQILVCSSLYKTSDNKSEILKSVFDRFIKPLLSQLIGKKIEHINDLTGEDVKPIEERFNYRYARESLIQFAEKLAKAGYKKDALWMAKIFINDSDPPKDGSNYPDDPKGELNEHTRVANGERDLSIRTVRGYLAWTLQKLVVPFSREDQEITKEIIPDCVKLVRTLCFDTNYYVRAEGCIPLIELVKNRHTHLPSKPNKRFISEELSEEIESIAFEMLTEKNINLKQIARHLAMVFAYIRTLGTQKAKEVINMFLKSDDEDVISEILPLFVYYALFRQNAFPTWQWKPLEQFNQTEIQSLLENQLKNGSPKIRAQLAWQFERLPDEIKKAPENKRSLSIEDAVKLTAKYMILLISKYDHDVFNDIYRFIEDYHQEYFDTCYELWTQCINIESDYFKKNWSEDKLQEMYWWPFFYNGKILLAIANKKGNEEFLDWFEKLIYYPTPVLIANDLDEAVEYLTTIKTSRDRVKKLFNRLMERNPKYYEFKQRWLNERKKLK